MNKDQVNSCIAWIRMNNALLGMIDKYSLDKEKRLSEVIDEFHLQYPGVKNAPHLNQYQLVTSLLVFIVLPKETFWGKLPDIEISRLPEGWGLSKQDPKLQLKDFLRRLRNSVAHGDIEVDDHLLFRFQDVNPQDKTDRFIAEFGQQEIRDFVQAFAYWCLTEDYKLSRFKQSGPINSNLAC